MGEIGLYPGINVFKRGFFGNFWGIYENFLGNLGNLRDFRGI